MRLHNKYGLRKRYLSHCNGVCLQAVTVQYYSTMHFYVKRSDTNLTDYSSVCRRCCTLLQSNLDKHSVAFSSAGYSGSPCLLAARFCWLRVIWFVLNISSLIVLSKVPWTAQWACTGPGNVVGRLENVCPELQGHHCNVHFFFRYEKRMRLVCLFNYVRPHAQPRINKMTLVVIV